MNQKTSEAITGQSVIQDIAVLIQLYEKLPYASKGNVFSSLTAETGEDAAYIARLLKKRRVEYEVVALLKLYELGHGEKLFYVIAELIAMEALTLAGNSDPSEDDVSNWLDDLAHQTTPDHHEVARLITYASDVEIDARKLMFDEGVLGTVCSSCEEEYSLGEGAYLVYCSIRLNNDSSYVIPRPEDYLNIRVSDKDFTEWGDDEWVLDKEAKDAAIRDLCIQQFAGYIASWRRQFFNQLLAVNDET